MIPIFDLTLFRQYQASGHRLLATRAEEQTISAGPVLLAVSGYMAHLRALASVTAAQSRVELAERLARQADDLLTDGVANKIDVSRAQVRLQEEQQRLIDAQSDSAKAPARIDDAFFGQTKNTVATALQRSRLAEQAIVLRNPNTPWRVAWTTVLQGQRPARSLFRFA